MTVRATTTAADTNAATASAADGGGDETDENNADARDEKVYLIERYIALRDVYLASSVEDNDDGNDDRRRRGGLARSLSVASGNNNNNNGNEGNKSTTNTAAKKTRKTYHELRPSQIIASSSSAKFYPVLEELIAKGEAAWTLALEKSREHAPELTEAAAKLSSAVTVSTENNDGDVGDGDDGEGIVDNANGVAKALAGASKSSMRALNEKFADASLLDSALADDVKDVKDVTAKEALDAAKSKAATTLRAAADEKPTPSSMGTMRRKKWK